MVSTFVAQESESSSRTVVVLKAVSTVLNVFERWTTNYLYNVTRLRLHLNSAIGSAFHGGRSSGRGLFRRRSSPRHSNRDSSYNGHRHADYDQFSSFHSSEIASAATASGYPYGVSGYQSVLPFLPSTEFIRSLQSQSRRRSSPGRIQFPVNQRGHSPISRRR